MRICQHPLTFLGRRPTRLAILVGALLPLAGCGVGPVPVIPSEEKGIALLIDNWNNAKNDPKKAVDYFAKGSTPPADQLTKYRDYTFELTNRPNPSGSSVTLPIEVTSIRAKEQKVATLDWTLEKEGEAWRIKAAPLP